VSASLPQVATALQHVLVVVPAQVARTSGFCRRASRVTAAVFVQTLVLGWLGDPQASLSQLTQVAAKLGVTCSPQALAQRFSPAAAGLLQEVLAAAVAQVVAAEPVAIAVLRRFAGVEILDSSTVRLPDALAATWPGCGGRVARNTRAALKLGVRLDLATGRLLGPVLSPGKEQDRASRLQHAPVAPGALRLADLGFWALAVFRQLGAAGAYWLSRLDLQTSVWVSGARVDLPQWLAQQGPRLDAAVELGVRERLPARLLGARVPQAVADERRRKLKAAARREGRSVSAARLALAGWTLLVTNAPAARLSAAEALVLARARWQIELLFKLWKDAGKLAESRSADPQRVLCEVYAKLTAMVVQHWVLLTALWRWPDRSLTEAAATVRREATCLVGALTRHRRLTEALRDLVRCLATGCRTDRRRARPNLHQLLTDPCLGGLA
jgi:hypothetical protein